MYKLLEKLTYTSITANMLNTGVLQSIVHAFEITRYVIKHEGNK